MSFFQQLKNPFYFYTFQPDVYLGLFLISFCHLLECHLQCERDHIYSNLLFFLATLAVWLIKMVFTYLIFYFCTAGTPKSPPQGSIKYYLILSYLISTFRTRYSSLILFLKRNSKLFLKKTV